MAAVEEMAFALCGVFSGHRARRSLSSTCVAGLRAAAENAAPDEAVALTTGEVPGALCTAVGATRSESGRQYFPPNTTASNCRQL